MTALATAVSFSPASVRGQGMPAEARNNIHQLFHQHTNATRKVTFTKDGYVAVTETDDPKLAKVLREHVSQMRGRLRGGRMVRGWDPAFRELAEHYDDISHRVEATEKGLRITVRGKTPEAVKVAKNHAEIVSGFATQGWAAHDARHPRVVDSAEAAKARPIGGAAKAGCPKERKSGETSGCALKGDVECGKSRCCRQLKSNQQQER